MHEPARSQLYGQIRLGRVSSVDAQRHTAQVQFEEIDGFVSWDLQVLVTRPGDYSLPAPNTPVLCVIMDGRLGVGYVLGAIYTESDGAPLSNAGQRSLAGDDVRLGDPNATDKVAMSPKVKSELDKIKAEFDTVATALKTLTGQATFGTVYAVGYSPTAPDAENVSAK
jgi:phage baseplate assembly protein gpV